MKTSFGLAVSFSVSLAIGLLCPLSETRADDAKITFELDIQPLLTKFGCNQGACHGKSRGQNGFALSLLGFDSDFDYSAIVCEDKGRRIFHSAPEQSLLLLKATATVPHGGGKRIELDSAAYQELCEWIRSGSARTADDAPKLIRVVTDPAIQSLAPREQFILHVYAEYSDGSRRDVTDGTAFQSNDRTIADISTASSGLIKAGPVPGETAIMARYMNNIAVCSVIIPLPGAATDTAYDALPRSNQIDAFVWNKLKRLGMWPSPMATQTTFHRRAYLRAIGRLPTPEETRSYLADPATDKREHLIDRLLDRPEYADFWANKWADLLRPNPYRAGIKATWNLDAWLRGAFRRNMPYDQFVRELLTAQGSTWTNGAAVLFRDRPEPIEIASSTSQLFLGIRLECAKCHHHPFEVWSQDDFYGFASFFSRVGRKGEGLSPPISGGEEIIFTKPAGQLNHGRTGQPVAPKVLQGTAQPIAADDDPREILADWVTDPQNPFFAKVMANRVWAEMMGQGIVDPVDDLRATNPPSNAELLNYLAQEFREHGFNIKHLVKTIMMSDVFGLSSHPVERNLSDVRNFSRYYRQRMRAEVLLDAINDVLETEEDFSAMPAGSRAMQLWTHRAPSLFLDTFGRPDLNQDPPHERTSESTTPQILHLMNSPTLNRKLALETAKPAHLAASHATGEAIVEEAYLRTYCRLPTREEQDVAIQFFNGTEPNRQAIEDLFWTLLNTPEFSFID